MYEYKFVHHPVAYEEGSVKPDYETLVHEYAADGWRLVQIFIPQPASTATTFELIFERERTLVSSQPGSESSGE